MFEKSVFFENFGFLHFSLDEACLGVDLARCECGIDMVDSALETWDLTLSKHDMIGYALVVLRVEGGSFSDTF